jgi:protein required for attachment to host cells
MLAKCANAGRAIAVYCLIVADSGETMDFSLKGVETTGKTRLEIAQDLEQIAKRLRDERPGVSSMEKGVQCSRCTDRE